MKNKFIYSTIFLSIFTLSAFSHGTEKHDNEEKSHTKKAEVIIEEMVDMDEKEKEHQANLLKQKKLELESKYNKINKNYLNNIKPIFEAKCFNCHSNTTKYPFYYNIPGIKSLIDEDIKEAKSHIDFSDDFPFISHETPINDLKSLKKIALEGGMPPLKYIIAHWDSKLSEEDKKAILKWSEESILLLDIK